MRKNLLLFLFAIPFCFTADAQFNKGTISPHFDIGHLGSIGFIDNNHFKRNYISFDPGIGYFVKNNWEIGVDINYSHLHFINKDIANDREDYHSIGLKLYTNYYLGKGKLKPYLTFQSGWDYKWGNYSVYNTDISANHFYLGLGGGVNWNIRPGLALFTEATFRKEFPMNKYGYARPNVTIGVRFFLDRKRKK